MFYLDILQRSYIRLLDLRMALSNARKQDLGLKVANCLNHVGFLSGMPIFYALLSLSMFFIFV